MGYLADAGLFGKSQVGQLSTGFSLRQGITSDIGEADLASLADLVDPSALVGIAADYIAASRSRVAEGQIIGLLEGWAQVDGDRHAGVVGAAVDAEEVDAALSRVCLAATAWGGCHGVVPQVPAQSRSAFLSEIGSQNRTSRQGSNAD